MSVNDTSTTLNTGTGGDLVDETQVARLDGTVVKRPRVVVGDDEGRLFGAPEGPPLPVANEKMLACLYRIELHAEKIATLLELALNAD